MAHIRVKAELTDIELAELSATSFWRGAKVSVDVYSDDELMVRASHLGAVIDADCDEPSGVHRIPEFAPARLEARKERLLAAGGTR